jgi:uncharacterized protein
LEYRKFGPLDWDVSALGFGCMRLPTLGANDKIDEPEAIRMLRWAIDHGVNYLDTAYPYHGGQSEIVVGKALQDGYRDKVRLATKLPTWATNEYADFDRILNEQLEKLQTEHIDFYLLHALRRSSWEKVRDLDVLRWAEGAMADGRIGHLGFSFHDKYEVFEEIVDAYDNWTFCQIQYNFIDLENQAGEKGLHYAADKGMAVVVMEPLLGGRLARPPKAVEALWDSAEVERSPVEWALQWLWNQPDVTMLLSGMSTMQHVQENVTYASRSGVGKLSEDELALVSQARDLYLELSPVPCTQCQYCMPCPNGVNIPENFSRYNTAALYDELESARNWYAKADADTLASACIQCRECEELCPQEIPISEWMPVVDEVLGQGQELVRHL